MEYKKALCVELHDSRTMISPSENRYAFSGHYGRSDGPRKSAYKISIAEIKSLLSAMGMEIDDRIRVPDDSHQMYGAMGEMARTDDVEFNIYEYYTEIDEPLSEKVTSVECAIVDSRMINIRVTSINDGKTYTEELTHVGSFTVWWEPDVQ